MLSGDSISAHTAFGSENRVDFPPKGVLATGLIAFAATLITYRYKRMMSSTERAHDDDTSSWMQLSSVFNILCKALAANVLRNLLFCCARGE
jgi:adenylosuccinate lyase